MPTEARLAERTLGMVALVGAGPGDLGLLTRRAAELLGRCDVVVYDRLINDELLGLCPQAKRIYVGKRVACHPVPQHEINQILVREGLAGRRVVRLKGGDPYIFGRGGEEARELAAAGVPFEVVPGVTSAVSALSYAGIPATDRTCAASVHFVTGHRRENGELGMDFDALARVGGTLVFMMAVSTTPEIARGLLAAGMDPSTPAAMVERGTTARQRRVDATLATVADASRDAGVTSPAILVVGEVCAFAETLDWYDKLPLRGLTVAVTRPADRLGTLTRRLRELGADVIEAPCIETRPVPSETLVGAIEGLREHGGRAVPLRRAALRRPGRSLALRCGRCRHRIRHGRRAQAPPDRARPRARRLRRGAPRRRHRGAQQGRRTSLAVPLRHRLSRAIRGTRPGWSCCRRRCLL